MKKMLAISTMILAVLIGGGVILHTRLGGRALVDVEAAAAAGDPAGEYELSRRFAAGSGVAADPLVADHWLGKASDHGHPLADVRLGLRGMTGVPHDPLKAEGGYWLWRAEARGDAEALFKAGVHTMNGLGMPRDMARSADYYRRAAEAGDHRAAFNLGKLYMDGELVERDDALAVQWLERAEALGDPNARPAIIWIQFGRPGPQ